MTSSLRIRRLCFSDIEAVLNLYPEIAPLVPAKCSPAIIEGMRKYISNRIPIDCHNSLGKFSLVAIDGDGTLFGFLLAIACQVGPDEECYIHLHLAGVSSQYRGKGTFLEMIELEKKNRLPMTAEILANNQSNMEVKLKRLGFMPARDHLRGNIWRWNPI